MFFLFTVYLKKAIPPSKISTKLKEMQISYDLFQAQHRQKIHTHYLVFHVGFPFILLRQWFPQVSSEIRSMVHGSLFCNSNLFSGNVSLHSLKLVLFWFRTPKAETEPWGSSWHRIGFQLALCHQVLALTLEQQIPSLLSQAFTQKSSSLQEPAVCHFGRRHSDA